MNMSAVSVPLMKTPSKVHVKVGPRLWRRFGGMQIIFPTVCTPQARKEE